MIIKIERAKQVIHIKKPPLPTQQAALSNQRNARSALNVPLKNPKQAAEVIVHHAVCLVY